MVQWGTGAGSRPKTTPTKAVVLAGLAVAGSPVLMLLASSLCPTAPSIQGGMSPASLQSQLQAPASTCGLQVWHLLQRLAGLQIILHCDQWKGAGWKGASTADTKPNSSALAELAGFWSSLWPRLALYITALHSQWGWDHISLKVWALQLIFAKIYFALSVQLALSYYFSPYSFWYYQQIVLFFVWHSYFSSKLLLISQLNSFNNNLINEL